MNKLLLLLLLLLLSSSLLLLLLIFNENPTNTTNKPPLWMNSFFYVFIEKCAHYEMESNISAQKMSSETKLHSGLNQAHLIKKRL